VSFQRVKIIFQLILAVQKSPEFFTGVLSGICLCMVFSGICLCIYALCVRFENESYESAYGSTKVQSIEYICISKAKSLVYHNKREYPIHSWSDRKGVKTWVEMKAFWYSSANSLAFKPTLYSSQYRCRAIQRGFNP